MKEVAIQAPKLRFADSRHADCRLQSMQTYQDDEVGVNPEYVAKQRVDDNPRVGEVHPVREARRNGRAPFRIPMQSSDAVNWDAVTRRPCVCRAAGCNSSSRPDDVGCIFDKGCTGAACVAGSGGCGSGSGGGSDVKRVGCEQVRYEHGAKLRGRREESARSYRCVMVSRRAGGAREHAPTWFCRLIELEGDSSEYSATKAAAEVLDMRLQWQGGGQSVAWALFVHLRSPDAPREAELRLVSPVLDEVPGGRAEDEGVHGVLAKRREKERGHGREGVAQSSKPAKRVPGGECSTCLYATRVWSKSKPSQS